MKFKEPPSSREALSAKLFFLVRWEEPFEIFVTTRETERERDLFSQTPLRSMLFFARSSNPPSSSYLPSKEGLFTFLEWNSAITSSHRDGKNFEWLNEPFSNVSRNPSRSQQEELESNPCTWYSIFISSSTSIDSRLVRAVDKFYLNESNMSAT